MLLFAFSSGPPQGRTGNAADGGLNCTACHRGADVNPDTKGKLVITVANYTPGVKQTIKVALTHTEAMRWGFQLTARVESDQTKMAGTFTPVADLVKVRCGLTGNQESPCGGDLEFVEHVPASTNPGTTGGRTWEFEWTPPQSNVGKIVFYAAGNAANNSNSNVGDFIYTTSTTIDPAAAGAKPAISRGGVAEGFNFTTAGISNHTWIAIFGTNLAPGTVTWDNFITGGNLPTTLAGTSVKINNKPAAIYFVSAGQINALAPVDDAVGDINVVVTTSGGDSDPIVVKRAAASPAFYAPFSQSGRLFLTGASLDGSIVGKVGVDPRVTRAAKPGETIAIFGTGFGVTNPVAPADKVVTGSPALVTKPTIRIGETVVDLLGTGNLIAAGLYQFNITIPASVADGDVAITAEIGGVRSANTVFLTIAR